MPTYGEDPGIPRFAPDETFPFFDMAQAERFRGLTREVFAEAGLELTVHADHLAGSDGHEFGLGTLATLCHAEDRGEAAWPEVVRAYVARLVRIQEDPEPFDLLTHDEVLARTYLRVVAAGDPPSWIPGREFAPGLVEVLNLDLPEAVLFFNDDHVARFGPAEDLRRAGLANLRQLRPDQHEVLAQSGGTVHVLLGDSMFTASTMLLLPEVVGRYDAPPDPDLGVFVAVPNRNQLDFHALRGEDALASLKLLVGFAAAGYQDAVGALTPEVYWWRQGGFERISRQTPDGIRVEIGPELSAVFEHLVRGG